MADPIPSVAVATGSLVVTGSATNFIAAENDLFVAGGAVVPIASRDGPTQITLKQPWPVASLVGSPAFSVLSLGEYWRSAISINKRFADLLAKWEIVSPFKFDAAGTLAQRDDYNNQPARFVYLATDPLPVRVFMKLANTNSASDWSGAIYLGSGGQVEFQEALDQERQQRTQADAALGQRIDTIAAGADPNVRTDLNAEITRSTGKDSQHDSQIAGLRTDLTAETSGRTSADLALGGRIDTEASARTSADNALGGRVDTEINARLTADSILGTRITDEANARIGKDASLDAADVALGGRIDAEAATARAAEAALGGRIDTERSERIAADAGLDTRLVVVEGQQATLPGRGIVFAQSDRAGFASQVDRAGDPRPLQRLLPGKALDAAKSDRAGFASQINRAADARSLQRTMSGKALEAAKSDPAGFARDVQFADAPRERRRLLSGKGISSALSDAYGYAAEVIRRGWTWRMGPALPGRMLDEAVSDRAGYGSHLRYREAWRPRQRQIAGRVIADAVSDRAGFAAPGVIRRDGKPMPGGIVMPRFGTSVIHLGNGGQSLSRGLGSRPIKITGPINGFWMFNGGERADTGGGTSAQNHASLSLYQPHDDGDATDLGETPVAAAALSYSARMTASGRDLGARNQIVLVSSWGEVGANIASLSKGQPVFQRFVDDVVYGYQRAQGFGLTYSMPVYFWKQGESDILLGTTRAAYTAAKIKYRSDCEAQVRETTGQTETLYCVMYQVGTHNWYGKPPDIALAQLDLCKGSGPFIMSAPMFVSQYRGDVHLTTRGSEIIGAYDDKAVAELMAGRRFMPVHPVKMTRQGRLYIVRYHVPVPPLVLDTTTISDPNGQFGLELYDPATKQNIAISNIRVVGQDCVAFTAAANASPAVVLRAAWSPPSGYVADAPGTPGTNPNQGARNCLRDSDPTVFNGPDFAMTLRNYCAISEIGLD